MREILFRGKHVDSKKWVEGYYMKTMFGVSEMHWIVPYTSIMHMLEQGHSVDPATIGQFTGLYDSTKWEDLTESEKHEWLKTKKESDWKGKRIFEGDIVKYAWVQNGKHITNENFVITYKHSSYCMVPLGKPKDVWKVHMPNDEDLIVIGNIYDNPEMVEGIKNDK